MSSPGSLFAAAEPSLTLASIAAALGRRRALVLWPMAVLLAAAALSCALGTPRYRATAEVQVMKEDGGAFGLESTVMGQGAGSTTDSLDYNMTLQTEAEILRSPALALAVIEAAHLEATPDYFAPQAGNSAPWLTRMPRMRWKQSLEPLTVPLQSAPNRRYAAERIFKAHFKVQPLAGTRLISISYLDPDPARAALVVNTAARVLADLSFNERVTAALQGSSWLSGQLNELRSHAEQTQARAAALEQGTGVFGNDASRNIVLERLDSLNQTLTAAESNRILKESIDKVAASGSPEMISSLSGNSSTGQVASINSSLSLIQGLRQQEAQARAQLAEASVRYGPAYPQIAELQAQLAGIEKSIAAETARLGQRAHTDWQIAVREEDAARAAFEAQKQVATKQNGSIIAYQLAREEAASSRELYESLLARLKQASLLQGLRANNISVVSSAGVPPPNHPASPNVPLRFGAAAALGLLFGLAAAAVAELRDTSIHSLAQIEAALGAPLLGVLPAVKRRRRKSALGGFGRSVKTSPVALSLGGAPFPLPVLEHTSSAFGEAMRSLRTALQAAGGGGLPQVILVTSCLPCEGKTMVAANLATILAQGGSRVLLVDADLRRPALHLYGEQGRVEGLANALSGPEDVAWTQPVPLLPKLRMLSGSEISPWPSELLDSPRLAELLRRWTMEHDVVVLDSPPVLPVTDALLLARHSDVTLLVARHQQTTRRALERGLQVLQQGPSPRPPIAVVLNDVAPNSREFQQYFGYHGGRYANQNA